MATHDPDKYHRANQWMGQMIETVAAYKECVEGGGDPAWARYQHHLLLLKEARSDRRMPDTFEQLIDELLELFSSTEQSLNELSDLLEK